MQGATRYHQGIRTTAYNRKVLLPSLMAGRQKKVGQGTFDHLARESRFAELVAGLAAKTGATIDVPNLAVNELGVVRKKKRRSGGDILNAAMSR